LKTEIAAIIIPKLYVVDIAACKPLSDCSVSMDSLL